jgi:hypothetical protein
MANYLERTFGSGGNLKKWTASFWMKPAVVQANNQHIFSVTGDSGNDAGLIRYRLGSNGVIEMSQADNGNYADIEPRNQLRDPASWYHIVVTWDSGNSTQGDRCIIYINGVRTTSFGTETYPSLNADSMTNKATWKHGIGSNVHNDGWSGTRNPFDGRLAHFHFCDGYAYAASDFGSTDSATGQWKPKTAPSVSYGTTGFFLKFETTSGNGLGTDSSGNGNHWTVINGADNQKCIQSPTNNFPVLNSIGTRGRTNQEQTDLDAGGNSHANTQTQTRTSSSGSNGAASATFALPIRGKWYWEAKWNGSSGNAWWGISSTFATSTKNTIYYSANGNKYVDGSSSSYGATYASGDIIGFAVDMDNQQVTFYKNNVSQGTITNSNLQADADQYDMFPFFSDGGGSSGPTVSVNFGDPGPGFSVSSAAADANGYGTFEYAPPTGFYALCTKNISQYGGT